MAASLDQQVVMAGGPKLSAVLGSSYFILRFKWTNLEMEPVRQRLRQQKAQADSAPKKKAALD